MLTFEYEQPMLISGVYITEEMLRHLSYIQTGTAFIFQSEHRKHNNEGVNNYIEDVASITHHLIGNMIDADSNEKQRIIELIEIAYFFRTTFEKLKLPEELLTEK